MNSSKQLGVAFLGVLLMSSVAARVAHAGDSWIATKVKIALLTTDGAGRNSVKADTDNGKVTLHGKVESLAVKEKAEATVRDVDGVTSVNNLVQVVPESKERVTNAIDKDVKESVRAALKGDKRLEDVHVDSVDNGLVLLSGKTASWDLKLLAIETAYRCEGARRVSSLIETDQK